MARATNRLTADDVAGRYAADAATPYREPGIEERIEREAGLIQAALNSGAWTLTVKPGVDAAVTGWTGQELCRLYPYRRQDGGMGAHCVLSTTNDGRARTTHLPAAFALVMERRIAAAKREVSA